MIWLRGQDLNLGPSGYEPDELPGCSTPRQRSVIGDQNSVGSCEFAVPALLVLARAVIAGFAVGTRLEDLAATYSPVAWATVPWALGVFTAEFGMGSGALPPLKPPGRPA